MFVRTSTFAAAALATAFAAPGAHAQYSSNEKNRATYSYLAAQAGGAYGTKKDSSGTQKQSALGAAFAARAQLFGGLEGPLWFGVYGGLSVGSSDDADVYFEMLLGLQAGYRLPDAHTNFGVRVFNWYNAVPIREGADDAMALGAFVNHKRLGIDFSYALPGEYILTKSSWSFFSIEARYALTESKYPNPGFFAGLRYDYSWLHTDAAGTVPAADFDVHHAYLLGGIGF